MTKVSLITRVSSHETPIIYFLSIKRHQPPTTLFPYTTLFRSREIVCVEQLSEALHSRGTCESNAVDAAAGEERVDRKSTRLNSSHVAISYAVFCLKKKTQKNNSNAGDDGEQWRSDHEIIFASC